MEVLYAHSVMTSLGVLDARHVNGKNIDLQMSHIVMNAGSSIVNILAR
jgi:hypothetical protein